ncbi:MAG: Coenzyme F420 hydrogenase/dehydrogenase, beta subunit C-terminal domain [bacterium]
MTKEEQLRAEAKKLLTEGKVEVIIGYTQGTLPCRTTPLFVREAMDTDKLVWNQFCENNLANYLIQQKGKKIGIVAKGCDARAIIGYLKERKLTREQVVIIGVSCEGSIDRKKLKEVLKGKEILEGRIEGNQFIVKGKDFEKVLDVKGLLHDSCQVCFHKNPVLYDVLIGEKFDELKSQDEFKAIEDIEKMSMDERWAYFTSLVNKCIRCYACRNVCPLCYCTECIVDQTQPQWFGKTDKFSDTFLYHLVRAFHSAGRCIDCGACVRACPVGIDLRMLTKKLDKDVRELYGYIAGENLEDIPPLANYKQDDPQGGFTTPTTDIK